jgi:hypothetical protein
MNAFDGYLLLLLGHLTAALVFLLVGWRLGRESAGKPMFDFKILPESKDGDAHEADPWTEAALGRTQEARGLDTFNTIWPFCDETHGQTPGKQ